MTRNYFDRFIKDQRSFVKRYRKTPIGNDSLRQISFQLYKKPIFDRNAYQILYYKSHKTNFDGSQLAALKSLYIWRDRIARREDESPR